MLIVLERVVARSDHLQLLRHVGSHKLPAQVLEPVDIFDRIGRHEFGLLEAVQVERQELQRVWHQESVVADDLLRLFAEAVYQPRDRVSQPVADIADVRAAVSLQKVAEHERECDLCIRRLDGVV